MSDLVRVDVCRSGGEWLIECQSASVERRGGGPGFDELMERLVGDLPEPPDEFTLLLSVAPFQDYQVELTSSGFWYGVNGRQGEGLLCPSLFGCVREAQDVLYIKIGDDGEGVVEPDRSETEGLRRKVEDLEREVYRLTMENELLKAAQNPAMEEPWTFPNRGEDGMF